MPGLNVLTDPWIPLSDRPEPATFVQLLTGERDADDLNWPRDDFKVFTRLLLSALVQALMPAKDVEELGQRIRKPMRREDVMARIEGVVGDFELLPDEGVGFLQSARPTGEDAKKTGGAARFVFAPPDLFLSPTTSGAVSLPVALITLFAEQTYAGGAGRGYGSGPGGQPGALTLVDLGSVRGSLWANTLAESVDTKQKPTKRPWSNTMEPKRKRGNISLANGLFFQPRAIWLVAQDGPCALTGAPGPTVAVEGFQPKHATEKDGIWIHPCAPMELKSTGLAPVRLSRGQPAWTGLAQLLEPLSRQAKKAKDPNEGPALVLQQLWQIKPRLSARLIVLDYPGRDKAKLGSVLYERFQMSDALERATGALRALTEDAEQVARRLKDALTQAHDDQKRGGFASAEGVDRFWRETEPGFIRWLGIVGSEAPDDDAMEEADTRARATARTTAMRIFDAHVSLAEWNIGKQDRIAKARRRLRSALFQGPASGPQQKEVRA